MADTEKSFLDFNFIFNMLLIKSLPLFVQKLYKKYIKNTIETGAPQWVDPVEQEKIKSGLNKISLASNFQEIIIYIISIYNDNNIGRNGIRFTNIIKIVLDTFNIDNVYIRTIIELISDFCNIKTFWIILKDITPYIKHINTLLLPYLPKAFIGVSAIPMLLLGIILVSMFFITSTNWWKEFDREIEEDPRHFFWDLTPMGHPDYQDVDTYDEQVAYLKRRDGIPLCQYKSALNKCLPTTDSNWDDETDCYTENGECKIRPGWFVRRRGTYSDEPLFTKSMDGNLETLTVETYRENPILYTKDGTIFNQGKKLKSKRNRRKKNKKSLL